MSTKYGSRLKSLDIHITICELNALHTKRQYLYLEHEGLNYLLIEAMHLCLRNSVYAPSLISFFDCLFFFFKQKTAYEMRISDWSSDVCSSDLSHPERSRMTNYRRAHTPGATWFFTVNIARRDTAVLTEHIALLRQALQRVRRKHPFSIDALVVLPDHLPAVWTLPPVDAGYAMRWRQCKRWFSRYAPAGAHRRARRIHNSKRGIWPRRSW